MPQMSPMNWLILFIMFSITFIMFNMMNYFSFNIKPFTQQKSSEIPSKSMNWKW